MAGFVRQRFRIQQPLVWLDQLEALVARELVPSPRKIRTALRIAVRDWPLKKNKTARPADLAVAGRMSSRLANAHGRHTDKVRC